MCTQEIAIDYAARRRNYTLDTAVKLLLLTSAGTYEAGLSCWEQKYIYSTVRPQEYISLTRATKLYNNSYRGPNCSPGPVLGWQWRCYAVPALTSPAFPEYPCTLIRCFFFFIPSQPRCAAGHSTFSNATATILALFTGSDNVAGGPVILPFDKGYVGFKNKFGWEPQCFPNNTTPNNLGCTFRRCALDPTSSDSTTDFSPLVAGQLGPFLTWSSLASNAGESRLYGGYHVQSGNLGGLALGQRVGVLVYDYLCANHIGDCSVGRAGGASLLAAASWALLGLALLWVA